jgi:hypothetical protein
LLVVLDMHNFGAYYMSEGRRGVRRAIGSNRCTIADFADVWRRISRSFHGVPGIVAYGLMNEPVGLPVVAGSSPAEVWRRASQAAVSAIRRTGDRTLVMVSGYGYAGTHDWKVVNPRPWIHDPAHHVRYEAHHYFDIDHSGSYAMTYDEEEAALGG